MRLGLRRRSERPAPPTPSSERSQQPSLALEHAVSLLATSPRCGVLDLGPPIPKNLTLYLRHQAKITIADLYRCLIPLRPDAKPSRELFDQLIPYDGTTNFDLVLAWDVLNYLTLDEIAALMESLNPYCSPSVMMLALVSSRCELPVAPSSYAVVDDRTLRREFSGSRSRPSPDYSEHDLMSRMPYAVVESRFQLRNQMVEYLIRGR